MQAIITAKQQNSLWREAAKNRLGRMELGNLLGLTAPTMKRVLEADTPLVVSSKTFTAVNNFLIEQLSKD